MSDGFISVGQCIDGLPIGAFAWELLFCGFLAWFLLGAISDFTPLSASFGFVMDPSHSYNDEFFARVSAMHVLGQSVAVLLGGWFADKYGRVAVIRPALVLTICCGTLMQACQTYGQLMATRFALGLCSGSLLGVVPPLLAELLPSRHRSFYLTVWCCGWPAGALFSLLLGNNWKLFYTWTLVPAVILYLCSRADMMPESPRYLYLVGRKEEGYEVLADMYEKEDLPLPWSADVISLSCAVPYGPERRSNTTPPLRRPSEGVGGEPSAPPDAVGEPSSTSAATDHDDVMDPLTFARACTAQAFRNGCSSEVFASSGAAVAVWLSVVIFCVSAASQALKFWLPVILANSHAAAPVSIYAASSHHLAIGQSTLFNGTRPVGGGSELDLGASGLGSAMAPLLLGIGRALLGPAQEPTELELLTGYDSQVSWVMAQAYILEVIGIFALAYATTLIGRKRIIQVAFLVSPFLVAAVLVAALSGAPMLCGPLFGLQLTMRNALVNFLLIFTSEQFPTVRRARAVAIVSFAAQLGTFTIPTLSDFVARWLTVVGSVACFSSFYVLGGIFSLLLPPSCMKEHPLQDVDKQDSRPKKQGWPSYQAV